MDVFVEGDLVLAEIVARERENGMRPWVVPGHGDSVTCKGGGELRELESERKVRGERGRA